MFEVRITRDFSAAHRVEDYPGNCERLHGHNWRVDVVARSAELDSLGMVIDFRKLKEATDKVLERLDHEYLNEVEPFTTLNPTAENLAKYIFDEVTRAVPVHRVDVYETESSVASYFRE